MKRIVLIVMLSLISSANADDNLAKICAQVSYVAKDSAMQIKNGTSIEKVSSYKELQKIYLGGGDFIQSEVKSFITISSSELTPDQIGGFYMHACYNKYIVNKVVIKEMAPFVRNNCPSEGNDFRDCIAISVEKYLAFRKAN